MQSTLTIETGLIPKWFFHVIVGTTGLIQQTEQFLYTDEQNVCDFVRRPVFKLTRSVESMWMGMFLLLGLDCYLGGHSFKLLFQMNVIS
jgi:hypothetical protein